MWLGDREGRGARARAGRGWDREVHGPAWARAEGEVGTESVWQGGVGTRGDPEPQAEEPGLIPGAPGAGALPLAFLPLPQSPQHLLCAWWCQGTRGPLLPSSRSCRPGA